MQEIFICPHVWVYVHVCEDTCLSLCVPMSGCGCMHVTEPRFDSLPRCLPSKLQGPPVSASPQRWGYRCLCSMCEDWKFNSGSRDSMAHLEPSRQPFSFFIIAKCGCYKDQHNLHNFWRE